VWRTTCKTAIYTVTAVTTVLTHTSSRQHKQVTQGASYERAGVHRPQPFPGSQTTCDAHSLRMEQPQHGFGGAQQEKRHTPAFPEHAGAGMACEKATAFSAYRRISRLAITAAIA